MKTIALLLIFSSSMALAGMLKFEKTSIKPSSKQKEDLCQTLADDRFCGSEINLNQCLKDFDFSGETIHVKNRSKLITDLKVTMTSKKSDFKFTKKEKYDLISLDGNHLFSSYTYEQYSLKGQDQDFIPNYILDSSCRGDGDND